MLLYQSPKITARGRTCNLHPAASLSFAILFVLLYAMFTWLHVALVVEAKPDVFPNENIWLALTYTSAGIEGLMGLLYFLIMVYACIGVHRWRKAKKAPAKKSMLKDMDDDYEEYDRVRRDIPHDETAGFLRDQEAQHEKEEQHDHETHH